MKLDQVSEVFFFSLFLHEYLRMIFQICSIYFNFFLTYLRSRISFSRSIVFVEKRLFGKECATGRIPCICVGMLFDVADVHRARDVFNQRDCALHPLRKQIRLVLQCCSFPYSSIQPPYTSCSPFRSPLLFLFFLIPLCSTNPRKRVALFSSTSNQMLIQIWRGGNRRGSSVSGGCLGKGYQLTVTSSPSTT